MTAVKQAESSTFGGTVAAVAADGLLELAQAVITGNIPDDVAAQLFLQTRRLHAALDPDSRRVRRPEKSGVKGCLSIPPEIHLYSPDRLVQFIREDGAELSPTAILKVVTQGSYSFPAKFHLLSLLRFYGLGLCERSEEDSKEIAKGLAAYAKQEKVSRQLKIAIQHTLFGLVGIHKTAELLNKQLIREVGLGRVIPLEAIKELVNPPTEFLRACRILHPEQIGIVEGKLVVSERTVRRILDNTLFRISESAHGLVFEIDPQKVPVQLTDKGIAYLAPAPERAPRRAVSPEEIQDAIKIFLEKSPGSAFTTQEVFDGIELDGKTNIKVRDGLRALNSDESIGVKSFKISSNRCWYMGDKLIDDQTESLKERIKAERAANSKKSSTSRRKSAAQEKADAAVLAVLESERGNPILLEVIVDKAEFDGKSTYKVRTSLDRLVAGGDSQVHKIKIVDQPCWHSGDEANADVVAKIREERRAVLSEAIANREIQPDSTEYKVYKFLEEHTGKPYTTYQIAAGLGLEAVSERDVRVAMRILGHHNTHKINSTKVDTKTYWHHSALSAEELAVITPEKRSSVRGGASGTRVASTRLSADAVDVAVKAALSTRIGMPMSFDDVIANTDLDGKTNGNVKASLDRLTDSTDSGVGRIDIVRAAYWYLGESPDADEVNRIRTELRERLAQAQANREIQPDSTEYKVYKFLEEHTDKPYTTSQIARELGVETITERNVRLAMAILGHHNTYKVNSIKIKTKTYWYIGELSQEEIAAITPQRGNTTTTRSTSRAQSVPRASSKAVDDAVRAVLEAKSETPMSIDEIYADVDLSKKSMWLVRQSLDRLVGTAESNVGRVDIVVWPHWYIGNRPSDEVINRIGESRKAKVAEKLANREILQDSTEYKVYKFLEEHTGKPYTTSQIASEINVETITERNVRVAMSIIGHHNTYKVSNIKIGTKTYWYHGVLSESEIAVITRQQESTSVRRDKSGLFEAGSVGREALEILQADSDKVRTAREIFDTITHEGKSIGDVMLCLIKLEKRGVINVINVGSEYEPLWFYHNPISGDANLSSLTDTITEGANGNTSVAAKALSVLVSDPGRLYPVSYITNVIAYSDKSDQVTNRVLEIASAREPIQAIIIDGEKYWYYKVVQDREVIETFVRQHQGGSKGFHKGSISEATHTFLKAHPDTPYSNSELQKLINHRKPTQAGIAAATAYLASNEGYHIHRIEVSKRVFWCYSEKDSVAKIVEAAKKRVEENAAAKVDSTGQAAHGYKVREGGVPEAMLLSLKKLPRGLYTFKQIYRKALHADKKHENARQGLYRITESPRYPVGNIIINDNVYWYYGDEPSQIEIDQFCSENGIVMRSNATPRGLPVPDAPNILLASAAQLSDRPVVLSSDQPLSILDMSKSWRVDEAIESLINTGAINGLSFNDICSNIRQSPDVIRGSIIRLIQKGKIVQGWKEKDKYIYLPTNHTHTIEKGPLSDLPALAKLGTLTFEGSDLRAFKDRYEVKALRPHERILVVRLLQVAHTTTLFGVNMLTQPWSAGRTVAQSHFIVLANLGVLQREKVEKGVQGSERFFLTPKIENEIGEYLF